MNVNGIFFELSIYYEETVHGFIEEIIDNLPFQLKEMSPATLHKKTNYNKATYYDYLYSSFEKKIRFSAPISRDFNNTFMLRYDDISNVITIMIYSKDCKDEPKLLNKLNDLLNSKKIINASFRDYEDSLLSTAYKISSYERRGIDTSSFKKKINIPFKDEIIDIEQFSRHRHEYGGIEFTSTYIMWFGKDFFKFVPQETLTSFKECTSNEKLENGTVRIQLYENINDYNSEEADRNQWAFRRHTNIDEVAEQWNLDYLKMASNNKSGANMEIETGKFKHGGVKLLKTYFDMNNKSVPKKIASKVVLTEYNYSNNVVFQSEELL
jgi:hypothetical protein